MNYYLNVNDNTYELLSKCKHFIDKSDFITFINNMIDNSCNCICVTRPRRFGKTTIASMLDTYYSVTYNSRDLYSKLKIHNSPHWDKYLNKFNVLFLNISNLLNEANILNKDVSNYINEELIKDIKEYYPDIQENTFISKVLKEATAKSGKKFIFIIDEWDAPFRNDKDNKDAQLKYVSFLENLFKSRETSSFLQLVYMTGILPIKQYKNTQSKLNNFYEYTMVCARDTSSFIGFTEDEVKYLCNIYNKDFNKMKLWYDGYTFDKQTNIYNSNSVIAACMDTSNSYGSFWGKTGSYESIQDAIDLNLNGIKESVIDLLNDISVYVDPSSFQNDLTNITSKDDSLTLLTHLGYLTVDKVIGDYEYIKVKIPNLEIKKEFQTSLINSKNYQGLSVAIKESYKLLEATLNKDSITVANQIEKIHDKDTSLIDYNNEHALKSVIKLAYYSAKNYYQINDEIKGGKGIADIVLYPLPNTKNKPAIIIELKYDKSTSCAIQQIKDKKYIDALSTYKGKVILVGINYNKSLKKHECEIEEITI